MTEPQVRVTEYEVSLLPPDHIDNDLFALTVAYRGNGLWAVLRHRQCLGSDGEWDYESIPSERAEAWIATHRFPLDEAKRLAVKAAPAVRMNGRTARQVADMTGEAAG